MSEIVFQVAIIIGLVAILAVGILLIASIRRLHNILRGMK